MQMVKQTKVGSGSFTKNFYGAAKYKVVLVANPVQHRPYCTLSQPKKESITAIANKRAQRGRLFETPAAWVPTLTGLSHS
jgi:hypothetical protein